MKLAQVSIFVIVAIALVAVVAAAAVILEMQGPDGGESISDQAFAYYESCIAEETLEALRLAGTQGGYIEPPHFVPGSDYAPFSSQLDFLGFGVPYWQYVSGNGLIKDQVPSKRDIETALERYLQSAVETCDFSAFADRGVEVVRGDARAAVRITDSAAMVTVDQDFVVRGDRGSARRTRHEVRVPSRFGALYRQALSLYQYERASAFLENYSSDVLYLYAPVDGVETSCAPRVWKTRDVVARLQEGLSANMAAVKLKGDYYNLQDDQNKYFVVDHAVEHQVRFLYDTKWPSRIEIAGAGQETMVAEPVGLQQGLGVLGFCYAPYHFVYDVQYPVLVQLFDEDEVFQFPLVVMINNNLPRAALPPSVIQEQPSEDLCQFSSQPITVQVRDVLLRPIDGAKASYHCFDQRCDIGISSDGSVSGTVPRCFNGYLSVEAAGFAPQRELFSSNEGGESTVILDRAYSLALDVRLAGGSKPGGLTLISFEGPTSATVAYPDARNVTLSEGTYNITVYVYGNTSVTIPASTSRTCTTVPKSGFAGLFGGTREACYDIQMPETKVDTALVGGGSVSAYLLPAELEKGTLEVTVSSLPAPTTLAQLQTNYEVFALQRAEVVLR